MKFEVITFVINEGAGYEGRPVRGEFRKGLGRHPRQQEGHPLHLPSKYLS